MENAGITKSILISLPPPSFKFLSSPIPFHQRLDNLIKWSSAKEHLFPFLWIDPTDPNIFEQIEESIITGVKGFKIICNHFYPSDKRVITTLQHIASKGKPVLFHSGILWDGDISSRFNRPIEFEPLFEIKKLRFALAHISWPWTDELIALFGKYLHTPRVKKENKTEMFIDTTPGTPSIYRKEVMSRLFCSGYNVSKNVIFGTDCNTQQYDSKWVSYWIKTDKTILEENGLSSAQIESIFSDNMSRFIGINS